MSDVASLPEQMLAPVSRLEKDAQAAQAGMKKANETAEQATADKTAAIKGESDELARQRKENQQFSIDHPFPHPDIKPWTEPPPKNDPLQSFGSWASAFGVIAGVLTKTGLKSSLNASAAAMNAIRKNDMDAYNEAKDVWKQNTEATIQNAEWEAKGYTAAFEVMKTDQALGLAQAQTVAAGADNKLMLAKLQAGNFKEAFDIAQGVAKFAADGPARMAGVIDLTNKLEDQQKRAGLYKEWLDKNKDQPPEVRAQMLTQIMNPQFTINQAKTLAEGAGGASLEPETLKREGSDYRLTGKMKAWGGGTAGARIRRQISDEAARQATEIGDTIGLQKVRSATLRSEQLALDASIKQRSAVRQFEETAKKNGRVLLDLIGKVDSTGVPVMEAWIRNGRKAIGGSPDVAAFDAQLTAYVPEVAKILSNPNMSGVTTDSARDEARAMIPENVTKKQLERIIPLLEADFDRRQLSIDDEITKIKENIESVSNPATSGGKGAAEIGTSGGAASPEPHPPVPPGVPANAQWSPSEKKFYWQEGPRNEWKSQAP